MNDFGLFRISVKGLIFDKAGKLLLIKEETGLWDLPGGSMRNGEALEQTL